MRAIYLGDTPIGFIMLHIGSGWEDGIDCLGKGTPEGFYKKLGKEIMVPIAPFQART